MAVNVVAGRFRVGLRVSDVEAAATFYRGLGFEDFGSVPGPDDRAVMTILEREGVMLIVDALRGMPFPDSDRERQVQAGPRGLGVAIGLGVDDLEPAYRYCRDAGCEITCEPMNEAWGDRVFECIDPFGYVWEFSQPISGRDDAEGFEAVRECGSAATERPDSIGASDKHARDRAGDPSSNAGSTAPGSAVRVTRRARIAAAVPGESPDEVGSAHKVQVMPRRTNTFQRVVTIVQTHMAGDATVEQSAMVTPTRGGPAREVDALITSDVAGHTMRVGVEASRTSRPATVEWVERMIGKHADLPTDRVILYSGRGFTAGALRKGRDYNLALISAEDLSDADAAEQVLGGLEAIWPKILTVRPIRAKVHVQRPDGSRVWFRAAPDVKLFLADGTELEHALRPAVEQVIAQSLRDIAERIDLKSTEESSETDAILAFPMWDVTDEADGEEALKELYVEHDDGERTELHRVTAVEMAVRIGVKVSRVNLTHARLGSVTVAYGELDGESLTGVFVATRGAEHPETATLQFTSTIAQASAAPSDEGGGVLPTDWTPPAMGVDP